MASINWSSIEENFSTPTDLIKEDDRTIFLSYKIYGAVNLIATTFSQVAICNSEKHFRLDMLYCSFYQINWRKKSQLSLFQANRMGQSSSEEAWVMGKMMNGGDRFLWSEKNIGHEEKLNHRRLLAKNILIL